MAHSCHAVNDLNLSLKVEQIKPFKYIIFKQIGLQFFLYFRITVSWMVLQVYLLF